MQVFQHDPIQVFLFAFLAYLGWGTGDVFGAIAARKLGGFSATIWSCILRVLIFSLYIPFALSDISRVTIPILLINILLGCLLLLGFVVYNIALQIGNPSLVGPIATASPALSVVLSIIFFHEMPSTQQLFAILVIFTGLLILGWHKPDKKDKKTFTVVMLSMLTFFCWGIYFTFIKIPVRQIGWYWPNFIVFATFPILFLFLPLLKKPLVWVNKNKAFWPLVVSIIITATAEFSYNYAVSRGFTSIVAPIAGSSPTLFFIVSYLVFREPLKKRQLVGIIITLLGIVALSVLST